MEAHLTDIFEMLYVNTLCVHYLIDHIRSHLFSVLRALLMRVRGGRLFLQCVLHTAGIFLIYPNLENQHYYG